jgi:hypothetical protein
METVFDLATPQELVALFGDGDRIRSVVGEAVRRSADYNFSKLAALYAGRGDFGKADAFLARIQDKQMRMDTQLGIYERI